MPEQGQLFVAMGAAIASRDNAPLALGELRPARGLCHAATAEVGRVGCVSRMTRELAGFRERACRSRKPGKLRVVEEQRPKPAHLGRRRVAEPARPLAQLAEGKGSIVTRGDGRAHGHEELSLLGHAHLLGLQPEGRDEEPARLGEEVEGTAEKGHGAADRLAAGEPRDRLVHHRLQDARGDVLPAAPPR